MLKTLSIAALFWVLVLLTWSVVSFERPITVSYGNGFVAVGGVR